MEKIVASCFDEAKAILSKNRKALDNVTDVLLVKETVYEDEFKEIIS